MLSSRESPRADCPLSGAPIAARDFASDGCDEAALVAAVAAGSRDALAELYRCHADACFTMALRLLGHRVDAEDVLQDVFLGLPLALRAYAERGTFPAWLRRVTARVAMATARRRRPDEPLAPEFPVTDADLETRMAVGIDIETAIAALSAPLRAAFVLRAVEGFSHEEIAELLGITPANAMQRFSRACKRLRILLD